MVEKNPLETLLNQIADMLILVKENENKPLKEGKLPEDFEERLTYLEAEIDLFADVQQRLYTQVGVSNDDVWKVINEGIGVNPKDQYFFDRAKTLEKDAREIHADLNRIVSLHNKEDKVQKGQESRARQKKFKKVGGHKGWIPM